MTGGGVCLIGFGTFLTAWRGQQRTGLQCGEETEQWKKGSREEVEEETRGKTEGESTLDEESMMTMRISVVRRP